MQDSKVAAVILAAGLSQRMGSVNKLHLPVGDEPLLRRTVKRYLAAELDEIIVVLGHEYEHTKTLLKDLPVKIAINNNYREGQMTSVHYGLASLSNNHQAIFIALGDQPELETTHIQKIKSAFQQRREAEVVVPFFEEQRGNPILISQQCRQSILSGERNLGCRRFIEKNPDLIHKVKMSDAAVITDLDTPEDYKNFIQPDSKIPESSVKQQ